ncbi:MAG: type II toxin-antitoxin system VapC family toxin [Polyangia bacterium]
MGYLVDTNVLSELARPRPDYGVVEWAAGVESLDISAVTVEELEFGLAARPNERIRSWFEEFLAGHCNVIEISDAIARRAGAMRGGFRARGVTRTQADMLIAATAAQHALTLVTRNVRDFEGCKIPLLDPFAG